MHWRARLATLGHGSGFTVGLFEVGRREKRSCGKDWERLVIGAKRQSRIGGRVKTEGAADVRRGVCGGRKSQRGGREKDCGRKKRELRR